ncbi:MAG: glycogen debranching enzyme [Clostridiales bacterium]|jgi:glycogen operon protein|nr:glycogen debranching enzyme [Clostridiales bacterium]
MMSKLNIFDYKASSAKASFIPLDKIEGYDVRPGFYGTNGATVIPCGVNFTVQSIGATSCELLLFRRGEDAPFAVLPFPEHYKIGHVYSMIVFGLDIFEFEYAYRLDGPYDPAKGLLFNKNNMLLDPYAKAVVGQTSWGIQKDRAAKYKARVVEDNFYWGKCNKSLAPLSDLIIYEMHVRGFTKHGSSGVEFPGTFAGIQEKIPYLKELGVNAVELMPIFEFDEMLDPRMYNGNMLLDYWGYNSVSFFAPNTSYAASLEHHNEGTELKQLISAFKENGVEVFLDVVFNHTAEGNELGPIFSFKGFDNNIYYLLSPDGRYYNFSGCGNTMNCNHPVVHQMILECLRYWVIEYRVDGFRFDLASILGRNEDGSPMNNPPLLQSLAFDPILGGVKLIAEAWDAGGLYQVGSFPAWSRWSEWNGKYRDDMRRFLKGDGSLAKTAMERMAGSPDLYDPATRGANASVNFITAHDGYTLYDLYAYQIKHNEANGWNCSDGSDDNNSWNCGFEGETDDPGVVSLRIKLIKNACAALMCSHGTPMFVMGDEFCNTQFGNNNPYCQDNETSWLDWGMLCKYRDVFDFFKYMIAFRKRHAIVRKKTEPCSLGLAGVSFHGAEPYAPDCGPDSRLAGVMFAGRDGEGEDDVVMVVINAHWEMRKVNLPELPEDFYWQVAVDTGANNREDCIPHGNYALPAAGRNLRVRERSVVVMEAKPKRKL